MLHEPQYLVVAGRAKVKVDTEDGVGHIIYILDALAKAQSAAKTGRQYLPYHRYPPSGRIYRQSIRCPTCQSYG